MEIILKAITDAREWQQAQDLAEKPSSQLPLISSRFGPPRQAPSSTMTICNVDGAWDPSTKNCGFGGVFSGWRPHREIEPLQASRRFVSSALMAEALAIRSAVMHAASLNIKSLMILSDSLSLVQLLKEGGSVPALFGILFDIYHFSSTFSVISFSYVPRLSNIMADSVAKSDLLLLNSTSFNGV